MSTAPAFQPGDIVGGRFDIVRWIGRGGMGEVYEAEDLELHERVALKTVRADLVGRSTVDFERLRREIQLARRVTHVNVCRLFEFQLHTEPSGEEIPFLTMELLLGETLSDLLLRKGRLSTEEAHPLVKQIVAGLSAAHEVGIIHRDFKSANIILVPLPNGGHRAVVTDFGLARDIDASGATTHAEFSGTPAYMAPEQVEGKACTAATDIYALGVVLFEMVTAGLPFSGGDSPSSVAGKRLTDEPLPPRALDPGLDSRWEQAILRCLQRDPVGRFARAEDVIDALSIQPTSAWARSRKVLGAAVVAALVVGGWLGSRHGVGSAPNASGGRRSLAVMGFKNLSGAADRAWLSTALSEMIATELSASPGLRLVPGELVSQAKIELSLSDADSYGGDTLVRIRQNLGTDLVVIGSYVGSTGSKGPIRLDLLIQDAHTGETVIRLSETGQDDDLLALVSRAGQRVRSGLHISEPEPQTLPHRWPSSNSEAARHYAEGVTRFRQFDPDGARALFQKAVAADSEFALGYLALSRAEIELGRHAEAREAAARCLELGRALSREERLLAEAQHAEASHDLSRVVKSYETLFTLAPDDVDYGLRLAAAWTDLAHYTDGEAVLDQLAALPGPAGKDPRITLGRVRILLYADAPQNQRALELARGGRMRAQREQRVFVAARFAAHEFTALARLRDPAALRVYEYARDAYARHGDQLGLAQLLVAGARYEYWNGQRDGTPVARRLELAGEAAAIYRRLGHRLGEAEALGTLSSVLRLQGRLRESLSARTRIRELRESVTGPYPPGESIQYRLVDLWRLFELGEIRRAVPEFEELMRRSGAKNDESSTLPYAIMLREKAELAAAHAFAQPLADQRPPGGYALKILSEILLYEGRLAEARAVLERAGPWTRDANGTLTNVDLPELRLNMAMVLCESGELVDAERMFAELAEGARSTGQPDMQLNADLWRLSVLVALGRRSEVRDLAERSRARLAVTEHVVIKLKASVQLAQYDAVAGDRTAAYRSLRRTIDEAHRLGYVLREIQAKATLAELVWEADRSSPVAAADLEAVRRLAASKGVGLVVQEIERLRRPK